VNNPELEQAIINRIHQKGVSLPALPDVAMRARRVADDPHSTLEDLTDVVSQDSAIAGRLIQIANSPIYQHVSSKQGLPEIVRRLGMRTVSQLVVSLAAKQLFSANTPSIKRLMQERWACTAQVAALSRHIATTRTKLDPDRALLFGLLHSIGGLPVISVAEDIKKLLISPDLLRDLLDALQPRLGADIIESWGFPADFTEVIQNSGAMEYDHEGDANYSDIVIASIAQTRGWMEDSIGKPIPAARKLGIDLDSNLVDEEIEAAVRMLTG